MRDDRVNYLWVGTFVLVVGVGLVVALALLSGRTGAMASYHSVFRNVTGLVPGTPVLFEGYRIGQVEGIVPVRDDGDPRFRVEVAVQRDWPIPEDSTAVISAPGLLAAFTLEIRAGDSATPLPPGAEIPADESPGLLDRVSGLAGDLEPVFVSLGERVPAILENVESITRRVSVVSDRLDRILAPEGEVGTLLGTVNDTAATLGTLTRELGSTRASLDEVLVHLDEALESNRGRLDRSLIDLARTLESVSRHVDAVAQNLEGASRNLYEFSRTIRNNPGALLSAEPPPDEAQ